MTRQVTVWSAGHRYRVTYLALDSRVIAVEQEIVPLRHASYWRRMHPHSKAWKAAVEIAARKNDLT